jgi:AcrR family transcriptional regulator
VAERLPKGRHGLTRDEVESSQRERILLAMAEAVRDRGYAETTVAHVLAGAGVSRETFYRLFTSKADCFAAAFDHAASILLARLASGRGEGGAGEVHPITAYLEVLAAEPAWARLFVVEAHAAGPDVLRRRFALQDRMAEGLARQLGPGSRFTAQVVVAAMSSMVARPLLDGDVDALRALGPPMIDFVRRRVD